MNKLASILATSLLAIVASAPAFAQEAGATLSAVNGTVMLSDADGGSASAQAGAAVASGQRLTVSDNASATVMYPNGCTRTYATAGVYTIAGQAQCVPVATTTGGVQNSTVATAVAVGMIAVPIIDSLNDSEQDLTPPPPVSR